MIVEDLRPQKLCLHVIPKSLTEEQKQHRLDVATDWFEQCVAEPNFLYRVITEDESWFFEYDLLNQQANKVYMKEGELNLKTPRRSLSNIKSMLIIFFDRRGIINHEFFRPTPETRGING